MSFHDVQFPTAISWGALGGPGFMTEIIKVDSGVESRNANWAQALGKWDVSQAIKTTAEMAILLAFFRARQGMAHSFRFKDWSDYSATAQATSPAAGTGAVTAFQIQKAYVSSPTTIYRTITKPVNNAAMKVYKNAVLQVAGYTIDFTTGIITFAVAPALGVAITADFEFDVHARFNIDDLRSMMDGPGVFTWSAIPIVELRS